MTRKEMKTSFAGDNGCQQVNCYCTVLTTPHCFKEDGDTEHAVFLAIIFTLLVQNRICPIAYDSIKNTQYVFETLE